MSGIMMSGMPLIFDKMLGFQDIYAVAPVRRRNIVLGFILGGAYKSTFQATIIIIIGVLSGLLDPTLGVYPNSFGFFNAPTYNPVLGVLCMIGSVGVLYVMIFAAASIYACIGLSISARVDMTNAFLWFNLINMPLVFISGAIIPVENINFIGLFNPTTYFADAIRVWLGGQIGDYGTGNWLLWLMGGDPALKNSNGVLLMGFGFDLIVMAGFGAILFYLCFKIFGSSLTESGGGITAIFHKKTAEVSSKMFKKLEPEEKAAMERITSKIDMLEIMQVIQSDPSKLLEVFEKNGLTREDANIFMQVGTKLMSQMTPQSKTKKKKKKSKN